MGSDRNTDSENLHQIYQENQKLRQKQMITIRISTSALEKARSLGKGYTIVIRNILEDVLMDDEKLKKYL